MNVSPIHINLLIVKSFSSTVDTTQAVSVMTSLVLNTSQRLESFKIRVKKNVIKNDKDKLFGFTLFLLKLTLYLPHSKSVQRWEIRDWYRFNLPANLYYFFTRYRAINGHICDWRRPLTCWKKFVQFYILVQNMRKVLFLFNIALELSQSSVL